MMIYGVSQSSGVERRLNVERGGDGIVLTFVDHPGGQERSRVMVNPDDLLAAITDAQSGGTSVEGLAPPLGPKMALDIEIKRNEVLLTTRTETSNGSDVAVGLDDFQDALETVISAS